jgi:hypothetical protein
MTAGREKTLATFLERFDGKPVEWGVDDCSAVAHLWLRELGFDLAFPRYSSRDEAHALIAQAGSLASIWSDALADAGIFERAGQPAPGDIGIVDTRRFGQVGVIYGAGGICCWRKEGGFFWMVPRRAVRIWAVT